MKADVKQVYRIAPKAAGCIGVLRLLLMSAAAFALAGCSTFMPPTASRSAPPPAQPSAHVPQPRSGAAPAPPPSTQTPPATAQDTRPDPETAADTALGNEVVLQALSLLGVPYRFGGNDPATGLDCSGLVRHVFRTAKGVNLPRRSVEIGKVGRAIKRAELVPGDLVFFNTRGAPYSHVAIYIGDGNFVHAPARRGHVRIEALNESYWQRRFNGARRIDDDDGALAVRNASSSASTRRVSEPLAVDEPVQ